VTSTAALRLLPSLRPSRDIRASAFGRFDEITDLVEKTSALTLPDFARCDILSQSELIACASASQIRLEYRLKRTGQIERKRAGMQMHA
jgi:hypothetical protein